MTTAQEARPSTPINADGLLQGAGKLWFIVAALGQGAFIAFILAFYGARTATGDFEGWNEKQLIDGHIAGDDAGNAMFAVHVLLAAVITLGGLLQLMPALRRAFPALHRWTGRAFLVLAYVMALSGAWLTLVRGTFLSEVSAVAILIDAVLILVFASLAWRDAAARRIDSHRRWAMRTFMAVSGVWFLRVGLMGWVVLNQGPVGLNETLSGPTDIVLVFGCYLIPLALLEIYFAAQRAATAPPKILAALMVLAATAFTAVGVFGTVAFMWAPHL
ncbi:MAG: DUF2306 domain-containing protein [Alphaproteobacteria bacterium]|nr:DUF2306 domain-containing protein [Alphaproteobacteria bacterium]